MSREIELKVPLSLEQFDRIEKIITKKEHVAFLKISSLSHIIKSDEYFSRYRTHEERLINKELRVIRIRSEKNVLCEPSGIDIFGDKSENSEKSYFCIKRKTIENGVEFNSEYETFVENPEVLRVFFESSGFFKWFEKKKDALSVFCKLENTIEPLEAHLELEKVNGLPYIEIEYTKNDISPERVKSALKEIIRVLGVDPEKRDSRSWAEIINEKF